MPFHATVLTLFPEIFPGSLGVGLAGKAFAAGIFSLDTINIRDYGLGAYKSVDDTPFGGGAGMVLRPEVLASSIKAANLGVRPLYYLSPRGTPITQALVEKMAQQEGIGLLCGRYEGIDERVLIHHAIQEISLGDFILMGGEVAALALIEAIVRLLPSSLGNVQTHLEESFSQHLLEYPHYTRPPVWEGQEVPPVLLEGNHKAIQQWRHLQAQSITRKRRPDLWRYYVQGFTNS
jgi:tRNA (guanine37-N1)-methyltransferase